MKRKGGRNIFHHDQKGDRWSLTHNIDGVFWFCLKTWEFGQFFNFSSHDREWDGFILFTLQYWPRHQALLYNMKYRLTILREKFVYAGFWRFFGFVKVSDTILGDQKDWKMEFHQKNMWYFVDNKGFFCWNFNKSEFNSANKE